MNTLRHTIGRPLSWLLAAVVLIATTGISVHQIYCYCLGETTLALFSTQDPCVDSMPVADACCAPKTSSCCAKKAPKQEAGCQQHKDGCTKKTTRFFQMKEKFTVELFKLKQPVVTAAATLPVFYTPVFAKTSCSITQLNKAPPDIFLSGRDIGIRLQVFRC
ncbi:MAG: hypothetical protein IPL65_21735 [Lewinellaceae bacterium]|nr:hypothetical protein [Lewinellaceae bacterium]